MARNKLFFVYITLMTGSVFGATEQQNQDLLEAVKAGNVVKVKQLLHVPGINVNVQDSRWETPALIYAIQNKHTEIAKDLINAGADVTMDGWYDVNGDINRAKQVSTLDMAKLRGYYYSDLWHLLKAKGAENRYLD